MEINSKSWHFRLFHIYGGGSIFHKFKVDGGHDEWSFANDMNLCTYSTHVLVGFIICLIIVLLGVVIGLGWIQGIEAVLTDFSSFRHSATLLSVIGNFSLAIQIVIGGLLLIVRTVVFLTEKTAEKIKRIKSKSTNKQRGFFSALIKAKKEKYCPMLTLIKNDSDD